jgi:predicted kinase
MKKNILNIDVTRPTQQLIVLRGIPGSGKSTMAKSIVLDGIIHSTDDLITATGDYRAFFARLIESGDFKDLSRMHSKNLFNAIKSMKDGISPVVIDNTNIKANEAKAYVVAALEIGFDDNNIQICDVGTRGLSAEQLAESNTHGVPLDKIQMMIQSHNSVGDLTVKKILDSKDMYKQSDVLYSCVLLDGQSKGTLMDKIGVWIPQDWKVFAHHMTINLGELKDKSELDKEVVLTVTKLGLSDMALAVQVEGFNSKNKIPHITIAINPEGGKPVMSNEITKWQDIKSFMIKGVVTEITNTNK